MTSQFGQVVLGPPGSGKTTYCHSMMKLLTGMGRKVALINLDPANESLPYEASLDINELVNIEEVMQEKELGPNGALVFCMELLEANMQWLLDHINKIRDHYIIMDFPGQAELYAHHTMIRNILSVFEKENVRLCSVFLVDAHYANDPGKYISAVLLALNSMLQMELPTVNILSKVDSVEKYGQLDFGLEFYTDVQDLDYLIDKLSEKSTMQKYQKLNRAIAEVVTDYSLVSFLPLSVDNRMTVINIMKAVDKANGYIYGSGEERNIQRLLSCAVGVESEHDRLGFARDEFMQCQDEEDEEELLRVIASQNVKE